MESSIDVHFKQLEKLVNPWHSALETAQKGIPPHITLLWPWKDTPIKPSDIEVLKNALKKCSHFQ